MDIISKKLKTNSDTVRIVVLALTCLVAFLERLFSIYLYESVIHEFDPYFNYRSTKYLSHHGTKAFLNWFDPSAWYPLGRIVGYTVYPGLMFTSYVFHQILHLLHITIDMRNVCVLLSPLFGGFTAFVGYLLGKNCYSEKAGLFAAIFIAIVPGYMSRSAAGAYDNEGIAIFALIFTFYLWVKAVKTGSIYWSLFCAFAYYYMVLAWGGYVFIINLIPLYTFVLLVTGRYSNRLYVAYSIFYVFGTMLSMQITFVGLVPVQSSEHMAALGMFLLVQVVAIMNWTRKQLTSRGFLFFIYSTVAIVVVAAVGVLIVLTATGKISPWTGRFYALLDPTYAKEHIPIIASVSEHQPTAWGSYFFDLHILVFLIPVGLFFCFKNLTDENIFIIIYGITSIYFSGVMVRLILVLAPAACVLGGIGASSVLSTFVDYFNAAGKDVVEEAKGDKKKKTTSEIKPEAKKKKLIKADKSISPKFRKHLSMGVIAVMTILFISFGRHCTWAAAEAYSSPSIVLAYTTQQGERVVFDDFREAYRWLTFNTKEDARIMSWWDYGYQLSAMANRTTLVDNNTWNNTHIAQVGRAMASSEEVAYETLRELDVDYILVIFGGMMGYSSDDINKFLWMVRIGGTLDPSLNENDYFSEQGEYRVDAKASAKMMNSMMYKMCYYRFGEVYTENNKPPGWDRVRNCEIGRKDIKFRHIEEAFTSPHWLVRIYRVLKPNNRIWEEDDD